MSEGIDQPGKVHLARAFWFANIAVVGAFTLLAARRMWRGEGFGDFHVFHDAFRAVLAGEDLYDSGVGGYIYPPLFAVVFAPLGWLSQSAAGAVYTLVNGAVAFACLLLAAHETMRRIGATRGRDGSSPPGVDRATLPAVMLFALAVFGDKFRIELQGGQTDLWILLCVLLALRWIGTRPLLAGFVLGLAGNLKYQSLVVLPYLIVRGRWRALGSCVASMAGLAVSTSLVFGWDRNAAYLSRAFGGLARMIGVGADEGAANIHDLAWIRSISLPSVFARLQGWAGWPEASVPLLTAVAAGGCLLVVFALYRVSGRHAVLLGRSGARDDATPAGLALVLYEWTGLLVAAMVFGPQTNPRHMLLMLPLGTIAGVLVLVPRVGGAPSVRRLPVLAASVFLLLAFVLPPGGKSTEHLVHAWRWIGGVSIAALTLLFVSLEGGLRWANGLEREPASTSDQPVTP